jgi:very-short-patch-repair endonuclease
MGGRLQLGGVVADFLFQQPQWVPTMVWRVQGEYFHYATSEKQVQDLLQRITLEDRGFRVVDILAHDVLTNREEVLQAALGGQQLKPTQILI